VCIWLINLAKRNNVITNPDRLPVFGLYEAAAAIQFTIVREEAEIDEIHLDELFELLLLPSY
jgi:hypothetical protein